LPQRRNAIKELRKNKKRRLHNLDIKTDLKKTVKKFMASINEGKNDEAKNGLKILHKKFDKAAKRSLIHANTASRRKAHYARLLNKLSASS